MATPEKRLTTDGTIGYRAKVRLKKFPSQSATFKRKTEAKEWAPQTVARMWEGRYFKTAKAKKHMVPETKPWSSSGTKDIGISSGTLSQGQNLRSMFSKGFAFRPCRKHLVLGCGPWV